MNARIPQKWRPTLGFIVFAVLATVIALPLVGLFFFRIYDNQLIHQTQAELIAQSSVLSVLYAREVQAKLPAGLALGAEIAPEFRPDPSDKFAPIRPALDLAGNDLVARRPDARPPDSPPDPAYLDIGRQLLPIMEQTQKVTLAGFRILDPHGTVIAGRRELGLSLAHIEEVAAALQGRYRGALRVRVSDKPPPPIYSISRGTGLRVFSAMPVIVDNRVAGVIYASRTPSNIFRHLYEERGKFILAGFAVLVVTILIGLIFSRTITRPMHELLQRIAEIRRGERDAFRPLAHYGTREFAQLSRSFLDMAESLSHRSDHISTFAAHLTHELKSPLTSIRGAAELLQDSAQSPSGGLTNAERSKFLSNILGDTERIEILVRRLRELAHAESSQGSGSVVLESLIGDLRARFSGLAIDARGTLDRTIAMSAENALIVLSHLADNAGRHHANRLDLEASDEAGVVKVIVANNGDAISEPNRDRIFEAFFTTRRDSGGTGMGLAIAQAMLHANGGSIRLLPSGAGAVFEVRFPAA
jgi:two-component system sensor histidine kinase CreC